MKPLIIIPARGGSKGIPHKNIKPLAGKPLIYYTLDVALQIVPKEDICVSTDDQNIIKCVEDYGLKVPFVRPSELATDSSGTYEVLLHALNFYEELGKYYDCIVLLQATSPFRNIEHVNEALSLYSHDLDMVVSVKESGTNPYYNCFEEDNNGFLKKTLDCDNYTRRQDVPVTYEYNGAIYIINIESLKATHMGKFTRRVKYLMDDIHSVDIDNMTDWRYAEFLIEKNMI